MYLKTCVCSGCTQMISFLALYRDHASKVLGAILHANLVQVSLVMPISETFKMDFSNYVKLRSPMHSHIGKSQKCLEI